MADQQGSLCLPSRRLVSLLPRQILKPLSDGSQRVLGMAVTPDRTAGAAVLAWTQQGPAGASERLAVDLAAYVEGPDAPDRLEASCVALVKAQPSAPGL